MKNLGTAITNLQDYECGRESVKRELVEKVGGMKQTYYSETGANHEENNLMKAGYNQAISDVLKLLRSTSKPPQPQER